MENLGLKSNHFALSKVTGSDHVQINADIGSRFNLDNTL